MLPALIQPFFPLFSFLYPNIYKHDQTEWVLKYIGKLLGKKNQDPSVNHLIVTLVSSIKITRIEHKVSFLGGKNDDHVI